jgi:hypothetical protein
MHQHSGHYAAMNRYLVAKKHFPTDLFLGDGTSWKVNEQCEREQRVSKKFSGNRCPCSTSSP